MVPYETHLCKISSFFRCFKHMVDYLFDYLCFWKKRKSLKTPIIPFDQSPIQLSLNSSDLLSIPYGVMNVKKKIKKIQEMFQGWFSNSESNYNAFIKAMLWGNVKEMNTYMNEVALATFSSFDTGRHPSGKS